MVGWANGRMGKKIMCARKTSKRLYTFFFPSYLKEIGQGEKKVNGREYLSERFRQRQPKGGRYFDR